MNELNDQKEMLEYHKAKENSYKDSDECFKKFLEDCCLECVEGEDRKMWRFAYDNALNWKIVTSKYGIMSNKISITNESINLQKLVSKSVSDPVVLTNNIEITNQNTNIQKPSVSDPVVLSDCVIVLKLLTSVARGKI